MLLCRLGLLLIRIAENATQDTWRNLRHQLDRMHLGTFAGPAGTRHKRTDLLSRHREIFRALEIPQPRFWSNWPSPPPPDRLTRRSASRLEIGL